MKLNDTPLHWQAVLLLKVQHVPFQSETPALSVKRLYLAEHPSGVLQADWTLPADERRLPLVQFTGWKPSRDVPFELPVRFVSHAAGQARIPNGTWVLPYDETLFTLCRHLQSRWRVLLTVLAQAPTHPQTLALLRQMTDYPYFTQNLN